jgi:hypothetical protein
MSEFSIQSDGVDVVRIMEQVRKRIKEKDGEDYTEQQIRELANVKLEGLAEAAKARPELVERSRRRRREQGAVPAPSAPDSFEFGPQSIYASRGFLGWLLHPVRRLLSPVLKLFFDVDPIVHALQVQREINAQHGEFVDRVARLLELSNSRLAAREEIDALNYEVMNNLVLEMTRLSIDMKNHRTRVESVAGRLDFDERRARTVEGVVHQRDEARAAVADASSGEGQAEGAEPKRRRRRRGRRRPTRPAAEADGTAVATAEPGDDTAPPAGTPEPPSESESPASAQPSGEPDPPSQ